MPTENVVLKRKAKRAIKQDLATLQLNTAIVNAFKSGRGTGWTFDIGNITTSGSQGDWVYEVIIKFSCEKDSHMDRLNNILEKVVENISSGSLQSSPWFISSHDGYKAVAEASVEKADNQKRKQKLANKDKVLGEINLEVNGHFDHIFSREAHIRRVYDVLQLGQDTNWSERSHCLLYGDPGSGKTEVLLSFAKLLGEEDVSYCKFDATSMTKAGVLENLIENPFIPPVLIIEEIEKCEESALRFLLGLMDSRGEIRRTNYRVGNQAKNVKMIVLATANDLGLLKTMMAGALYSRFTNKIFCDRPDRNTLHKILEKKIINIPNKNNQWIEEALSFGYDELGLTDPRDLISICICGRDRLLDGSYQEDYRETSVKTLDNI